MIKRRQLCRGRRVRLEQRGDQTVQRLGIGHSVQTVVDHADDEPVSIMPAILGRGVKAAQIGAVGQAFLARQDLVGAHPPQKIGTRCGRRAPQLETDEGPIGEAQHAWSELRQQVGGQSNLARVIAAHGEGPDRMRTGLGEREQTQLGKASRAA